jgi:hypothetical protein
MMVIGETPQLPRGFGIATGRVSRVQIPRSDPQLPRLDLRRSAQLQLIKIGFVFVRPEEMDVPGFDFQLLFRSV